MRVRSRRWAVDAELEVSVLRAINLCDRDWPAKSFCKLRVGKLRASMRQLSMKYLNRQLYLLICHSNELDSNGLDSNKPQGVRMGAERTSCSEQ